MSTENAPRNPFWKMLVGTLFLLSFLPVISPARTPEAEEQGIPEEIYEVLEKSWNYEKDSREHPPWFKSCEAKNMNRDLPLLRKLLLQINEFEKKDNWKEIRFAAHHDSKSHHLLHFFCAATDRQFENFKRDFLPLVEDKTIGLGTRYAILQRSYRRDASYNHPLTDVHKKFIAHMSRGPLADYFAGLAPMVAHLNPNMSERQLKFIELLEEKRRELVAKGAGKKTEMDIPIEAVAHDAFFDAPKEALYRELLEMRGQKSFVDLLELMVGLSQEGPITEPQRIALLSILKNQTTFQDKKTTERELASVLRAKTMGLGQANFYAAAFEPKQKECLAHIQARHGLFNTATTITNPLKRKPQPKKTLVEYIQEYFVLGTQDEACAELRDSYRRSFPAAVPTAEAPPTSTRAR